MHMAEVTVVIPNYNGIGYLKDCLDTLREQTCKNYETVLVDNGSTDGSLAFVKEHYPWVKILALDRNYGFCHAVNAGIRAAESSYVFLLNNDTKLHEDCIEELLIMMRQHPHCFSCSARMIKMHEPDKLDDAGDYYCALGWAYALGKDRPWKDYLKPRKVFAACGGASMYRRSVFEKIGRFDEAHFAYLEDIDVGYRAQIYGYENWYCPRAVVWHVGSGTSGSRYNEFKVRHSSRNNVYMIYKNMPFLQIILNLPLLIPGFVVKWLFFVRKGFGKEYANGIFNGIAMSDKEKKVPFQKWHLWNYVRIQVQLWVNVVRRFVM